VVIDIAMALGTMKIESGALYRFYTIEPHMLWTSHCPYSRLATATLIAHFISSDPFSSASAQV